jgi:hypothetical protein
MYPGIGLFFGQQGCLICWPVTFLWAYVTEELMLIAHKIMLD